MFYIYRFFFIYLCNVFDLCVYVMSILIAAIDRDLVDFGGHLVGNLWVYRLTQRLTASSHWSVSTVLLCSVPSMSVLMVAVLASGLPGGEVGCRARNSAMKLASCS